MEEESEESGAKSVDVATGPCEWRPVDPWPRLSGAALDRRAAYTNALPTCNLGEAFVYWLRDPITRKVRYVGSTASPRQRAILHCHRNRLYSTQKWIASLLLQDEYPILEVIGKHEGRDGTLEILVINECAAAFPPGQLLNRADVRSKSRLASAIASIR